MESAANEFEVRKSSIRYKTMMKVKYIGSNIGVTGLIDGNVYEVSEVDVVIGALRVIDEDQSNWNYKDDPNWKPGYLYSPTNPRPIAVPEQEPGKFFIVEDENNQLKDIGVLPMPQFGKKYSSPTPFCILIDDYIDCVYCMENQHIIDASVRSEFKQRPNWRDICSTCEYNDFNEQSDPSYTNPKNNSEIAKSVIDIPTVSRLLNRLRELISLPSADVCYSTYATPDEAIEDLYQLEKGIIEKNFVAVRKLLFLLLPTGDLQEISIDSGFGNEFLKIAEGLENALGVNSEAELYPEQAIRQAKAMSCKPPYIDHDSEIAIFTGTDNSKYETTYVSCTCPDFTKRKLPCKHIYRLRHELLNKELRNSGNSALRHDNKPGR